MWKKRITAAIISLLVLFYLFPFSSSVFATIEKDTSEHVKSNIEVQYFYMSPCESCRDGEKFLDFFEETVSGIKDGPDSSEFKVPVINTFKSEDSFVEICDKLGIPSEKRTLPMVVIGDQYIQGQQVIEEELGQFIQDAAADRRQEENSNSLQEEKTENSTDPVQDERGKPLYAEDYNPEDAHFVYFYTATCSDCTRTLNFFEKLAIEYSAEDVSIEYKYILDPQILDEWKRYAEIYDLPEEHRSTPIIFYRDGYLHGYQAIQDEIRTVINEGKATQFVPPDAIESSPPEEMNLWAIAGVGFLNGLNPCSVSMLLFLFSMLLSKQKNIFKMALAYMGGRAISYFLIGITLYSVLSLIEAELFYQMNAVVTIILVVICLVLAVMNLLDYFAARKEKYAKIRVQLPVKLRRLNHKLIEKMGAGNSRFFLSGLFILGFLISLGEFACTGQIYVATILSLFNRGDSTRIAMLYFAIYVIFMSLPFVIISIVVNRGKKLLDMSEISRRFMPYIKLINAALFILFGILATVQWYRL